MSPHVYIFNTDPDYSSLLSGICRTTDLNSSEFNTAADFLQQIPLQGILVLDIKMSFCDGLDILKRLSGTGSRLRLILISSYDGGVLNGARQLAQSGGLKVCDCLRKPVLVAGFRGALRKAAASFEHSLSRPFEDAKQVGQDHQKLQFCWQSS